MRNIRYQSSLRPRRRLQYAAPRFHLLALLICTTLAPGCAHFTGVEAEQRAEAAAQVSVTESQPLTAAAESTDSPRQSVSRPLPPSILAWSTVGGGASPLGETAGCRITGMQAGSLRSNVQSALQTCGWQLGYWFPGNQRHMVDWMIPVGYRLEALDLGEFFEFLHQMYGIAALVRSTDGTVDFVEVHNGL